MKTTLMSLGLYKESVTIVQILSGGSYAPASTDAMIEILNMMHKKVYNEMKAHRLSVQSRFYVKPRRLPV